MAFHICKAIFRSGLQLNASKSQSQREGYGWQMLSVEEPFHVLEQSVDLPSVDHLIFILTNCRRKKDLAYGKHVLAYICSNGMEVQRAFGNYIVPMFVECGSLSDAQWVFNSSVHRNEHSWTSLIVGYIKYGQIDHALNLYWSMLEDSVCPSKFTFVALLRACTMLKGVERGQEVHAEIARLGFEWDLLVGNTLVSMYAKHGSLLEAQEIFDRMPVRDAVSWNAFIAGYMEHEPQQGVWKCFEHMQLEGMSPDVITFVFMVKASGGTRAVEKGREKHMEIIQKGFEVFPLVGNTLINMYAKCGSLLEVQEVFDKLALQDVFTYNSLIKVCAEHGHGQQGLRCFQQMQLQGVSPNNGTFVSVLRACCSLEAIDKGREIHMVIIRDGFESESCVNGTLVGMYAKCGSFLEAQEVFNQMPVQGAAPWTALIVGYTEYGYSLEALECFEQMQLGGVSVDVVTQVCVLKACGSIGAIDKSREIHTEIIRKGFEMDPSVCNSLVHMYAKCGSVSEACEVFSKLPVQDAVSWNALIAGSMKEESSQESLKYFEQMLVEGMFPDPVTFACILNGCGSSGAIDKGHRIHTAILQKGFERDLYVENALLDMYVKCNSIPEAQEVFAKLPVRDVVSWNIVIAGYADCGPSLEALSCFEQMQLEAASPDAITMTCVLKACGSIGAIEKGREIHIHITGKGFENHDIVRNTLVDMYAKYGSLSEAQEVFNRLSVQDVVPWTMLIAGYSANGFCRKALHCFERMQREGIPLNDATFVCILKLCSRNRALGKGQEIHREIIQRKLERFSLIGNTLVNMYAKCGSISEAQDVFDKLPVQDVVSWTVLIAGYAEHGPFCKALTCFEQMQLEGVSPNAATYICALKACGNTVDTCKGLFLHNEITQKGFELDYYMGSTLVCMYAKCALLLEAWNVFDKLSVQNFSWNAQAARCMKNESGQDAQLCFEQMQSEGIPPNAVTFVCGLKACSSIGAIEKGREMHLEITEKGFDRYPVIGSSLVDMYARCGSLSEALEIFDKLLVREDMAWMALIAGYAEHGYVKEVLKCFGQMQLIGVYPNVLMLICALKSCGSAGAIDEGREIHMEIMHRGLEHIPLVVNTLVNMYAKCGLFSDAREFFVKLSIRDVVAWTAMIAAYAEQGFGKEVLECFEQIQLDISPDSVMYVSVLKACGSTGRLDSGRNIHAGITEKGLERNLNIRNTLIDMYCKCGSLSEAWKVFSEPPSRDVVSWNVLMAGYLEHGFAQEALKCVELMVLQDITLDAVTFVYFLKACDSIGALGKGREIHTEIIQKGFEIHPLVGNTLIDLYAKCGSLAEAQEVFDHLLLQDVVSWNALISGYTMNCEGDMAFCCFENMVEQSVKPNAITFMSVLTACSHSNLVVKGHKYFKVMTEKYCVEPMVEHYTCMIDLLARSGHLDEAEKFLGTVMCPVAEGPWRALLTGCKTYGGADLGLRSFYQLVKMNPESASSYVLMADIYASANRWDDGYRVEEQRKCAGAMKKVARALIEVSKNVHEFAVGDNRSKDISATLEILGSRMKEEGHVPNIDLVSKPASNEKEAAVCELVEKNCL